jgi:hypothetical protein
MRVRVDAWDIVRDATRWGVGWSRALRVTSTSLFEGLDEPRARVQGAQMDRMETGNRFVRGMTNAGCDYTILLKPRERVSGRIDDLSGWMNGWKRGESKMERFI